MRFITLFLLALSKLATASIDLAAIEKELKGGGLEGEVHGATFSLDLYVFVYRNPENFFDHAVFPLITKEESIQEQFKSLGRHDRIKIKGAFASTMAPINHILVNELSMVKKFENHLPVPPYQHEAKLPRDLVGKSHFIGKVHAIVNEAKILVVEYKDAVIPVYVENTALLKDLYRNDKIDIYFKIRMEPGRPVHIELDKTVSTPLKVLDRMVSWHGKSAQMEGNLVMFPKSPQVLFNVFALHQVDENGIERDFTLVNFDDPKAFEKIRIKLQEWWDAHPGTIKNIRNKYLNTNVKIRAAGSFNVVDPEQANPQILLSGPEDLTLIKSK